MSGLRGTIAEVREALAPLKRILVPLIAISSVYNILLLAGSFFMLLVYDDVLPSRSVPSLVSLFLLVLLAYAFQAFLDIVRGRIMVNIGTLFTRKISDRVLDVISRHEMLRGPMPAGIQIVRDVDTMRSFFSGQGPLAFLDLPWILVYLLILFIFHWSIGVMALAGVFIMVVLLAMNSRLTEPLARETVRAGAVRFQLADGTQRNAETLKALGMTNVRRQMWHDAEEELLRANDRLAIISTNLNGITKAFRMLLQSATLALGAYLVIAGNATGGIIIAASILTARAVAPMEQVIQHWKSMVASRQAQARITDHFQAIPPFAEPMGLEPPHQTLVLQAVTSGPPGARIVTVADVSFKLKAGDALAVVGASGSGKTALVRAICGIWPTLRGSVRLDGATLDQWTSDQIAGIIGYVPQSIELFEGTVAQNISRFSEDADRDAVLAAAKAADCHEMIVRLPDGYDYRIDQRGGNLSAGQQQRLALARALYGDPFLIVLDEPNSNLDFDGEAALGVAIRKARERGAIVVVVAHRAQVVAHVSHIMVMNNGRVESFETKEEFDERKRKQRLAQLPSGRPGGTLDSRIPARPGTAADGAAAAAGAAPAAQEPAGAPAHIEATGEAGGGAGSADGDSLPDDGGEGGAARSAAGESKVEDRT